MREVILNRFDPIIYPYKIWVAITQDFNDVSGRFLSYDGKGDIKFLDTDKCHAMTMSVMHKEDLKYGALILFKTKKDGTIGTIAHESSHAAKLLFEHIGADASDHEPFEYLLGWIAECVQAVFKTKKEKNEQRAEGGL